MREAGLAVIDRMPPKLAGSAETIGRQAYGRLRRVRRAMGRLLAGLVKTLPREAQRPLRRFWFRFLALHHGRFRSRTIALDGPGPTLLVDAGGVDLDELVERILRDSESFRLIVLVSDPIVHRTRDLPALVEYIPSFRDFPNDFLPRRVAEIKRVYDIENVITWNTDSPFRAATSVDWAEQ